MTQPLRCHNRVRYPNQLPMSCRRIAGHDGPCAMDFDYGPTSRWTLLAHCDKPPHVHYSVVVPIPRWAYRALRRLRVWRSR